MSFSYTVTTTETFTVTHARHLAAKVATDLKRVQRLYGRPSDGAIAQYEEETIILLKAGQLKEVTYGFQRHGLWIEPTLRYTARQLSSDTANDDPGHILPGADVTGAHFNSFLVYADSWPRLSDSERTAIEGQLPFTREGAPEPGIDGYLTGDRTYSSGGRVLDRSSVRGYR